MKDSKSSGKKKNSPKGKKETSNLPKDLPGREAFIEAGINFETLKKMSEEDVKEVKGIGDATTKQLETWIKKNKPE